MSDFLSDAYIVDDALRHFVDGSASGEALVIHQRPMATLVEELELERHAAAGDLTGESLSEFLRRYLECSTRLHHPAYLAHQVAVPHYAGSLGAMVDGLTNNAMAIYEMGPAASTVEYFVLNWMISRIGWKPAPYPGGAEAVRAAGADAGKEISPHAAGVLTHGGSLANRTALIAARTHAAPDVWESGNPPDLALLAPAESHYSISRAAGILGLGSRAVYPLEVDARGVVIPDRIPAAVARAEADGKRPFALVANACSTALGLYDPLREIGQACKERGIWLHVDGAHGAAALLSRRHKGLVDGIELADSVVWDAHKLMRTPTLCAAVLVREARRLDRAFQQEASYLFHEKEQPGVDFIHRTVECTKAGLGLRFFFVLAAMGERGLERYIDGRFALARAAYRRIAALPDFECAAEPQSNILCFRLKAGDEIQMAVRAALISRGDFYLSTAAVNGTRYLRAVFMNPDTGMPEVERLIERIREVASRLTSDRRAAS